VAAGTKGRLPPQSSEPKVRNTIAGGEGSASRPGSVASGRTTRGDLESRLGRMEGMGHLQGGSSRGTRPSTPGGEDDDEDRGVGNVDSETEGAALYVL
jgi:hypothetical protein